MAKTTLGNGSEHDSPAVRIALAHIHAWSHHDWDKTKEMLAPNIHAYVTTTQPQMPQFGGTEFTGIENYMVRKKKGA